MSVNQFIAEQSIDQLREWICASSPRREKAIFDIAISAQGRITRVSSNLPEETPAFDFGCLQDVLLGMKTMDMARAGRFDLDEAIGAALPELCDGTAPGAEIRFRDLLNHASGLWIENAPDGDPAITRWDHLVAKMTSEPLRFPPNRILVYSIIERVILVEALSRSIGRNVYDEVLQSAGDRAGRLGHLAVPPEIGCGLRAIAGGIEALAALIKHDMPDWWRDDLRNGRDEFPILAGPCDKPWVPVATKMGMLRFANGTWGQNGQSVSGSFGFRIILESGDFAIGWFPSQFERDLAMGILAEDLRGETALFGDPRMGALRDFSMEELCGGYKGVMMKQLDVSEEDGKLEVRIDGKDAAPMRLQVMPDGVLTSRIPHPSMWLEAFPHPSDAYPCLRVGMSVFAKNLS